MYRRPASKKKSVRQFKNRSAKTQKINVSAPLRGGFRL